VQLRPTNPIGAIGGNDGALQLAGIETRSEVEKRPLGSCSWDSRRDGDMLGRQRASLVQSNTVRPTVARATSHLNRTPRTSDIPKRRRTSIGQHGMRATCKNGCEPLAMDPNAAMPQCENPPVQDHQSSTPHSIFNLPPT
jgi:hypothetical protein